MPAGDDGALAADLADRAGTLLLRIRGEGREAGARGDRSSNELLLAGLADARPDDAVLSEESEDDKARLAADRVWIIDPLDGTREYGMPGRSDWAVHVALWERGQEITAAAVGLPELGTVLSTAAPPPLGPFDPDGPVRTVHSDSRPPQWLPALGEAFPRLHAFPMGSAGAKAMAVVRGEADAYVHDGGQWEWDSAAPVGVALAAGLHCSRLDGSPLRYNQDRPYLPDLVICRREVAGDLLDALAEVTA
ncbi:3'(2'),5'-bisphosphate nucleotidase CysQ [Acidimicrobiaceae bacterium USS-CC1]|uniref:3'(2'),5'-bisphosphate nucleotidase CysQ n=1 Tax=Acidiferrimicrobium australe TaxID=2664430 RepID=A0ABW9QY50_9ACTN|nr:3'(2'),5'-bisphosphate nucleotidase CysQ [Acidiferrimicrobium australe]